MADNAENSSASATLSFKVKSSGDKSHSVTMPESATVLDLKTKLAGEDFENIPAERQRLIYSGRVMKNDETLSTYKIKAGNTIHMVKSAASNPAPTSSASTAAPQAVPQNMAAGTAANNILAGLTGARFAGHANLPSRDLFGADGGMGAPPNEDQMADMLSNPAIAQTMNEALNNPTFVDYMIQSNPMLANMPNAREMIQSPYFRNMMTNPEALRMASRMRRMMGTGGEQGGGFPAPGATDTTPADAASSDSGAGAGGAGAGGAGQAPPPFAFPGMFGLPGGGAGGDANPFAALMNPSNPFGAAPPQGQGAVPGAPPAAGQTTSAPQADSTSAQRAAGDAATQPAASQNAQANPFAAIFGGGMPGAQPGGAGGAAPPNPFGSQGLTPEMIQQAMQMWGAGGMGGGGMGAGGPGGFGSPSPASPPDNRPPEERYAEQLRQLNDMGFFDFDTNVAALRRSGGSVQGAIEHLLSGP